VNRLLNTFLLWLLMLALPMQGYAAAAMFECGTTHQQDMAFMDGSASSHNQHAHHHGQQHDLNAGDASHDAPSGKSTRSSTCSTCQTCCFGAALIPAGIEWNPPIIKPGLPTPSLDILFSGHISAGLERPPRFFPV
jgi:hypothetical protein